MRSAIFTGFPPRVGRVQSERRSPVRVLVLASPATDPVSHAEWTYEEKPPRLAERGLEVGQPLFRPGVADGHLAGDGDPPSPNVGPFKRLGHSFDEDPGVGLDGHAVDAE